VKAGPLVQISEVRGGASYLSQNDLRLHFGLGANDKMNEVEIRWPTGETEILRDVAADLFTPSSREREFRERWRCPVCRSAESSTV
jgi:enediyne biosynthesis protein E4